jgi:DNA-binding NarL/FixJ family response regulator
MATMGVIELAQRLREAGSVSKITFLSVHDDVDFVNAALGASGTRYVIKPWMTGDLVPAIHAALAGKLFISAVLMHQPPS